MLVRLKFGRWRGDCALTRKRAHVSYRIQAFFRNPGRGGTGWIVRFCERVAGKAVSNRKQTVSWVRDRQAGAERDFEQAALAATGSYLSICPAEMRAGRA